MDSSDLASFIADNDIKAEIVYLPVETLTVAAAAEAMKVRPEQIIKSVLFLADGQSCVGCGQRLNTYTSQTACG